MKNLILAFAVTGIIGLSSCNKNWECQCIAKNGTATNTTNIHGGTFHHARHTCNGMASSTQDCSLLTDEK